MSLFRILLALLLCLAGTSCSQKTKILADVPSKYNERIFVIDDGGYRYLRFGTLNGDDQSMIDPKNPDAVPMEYIRLMGLALPLLEPEDGSSFLVIGLGGGAYPRLLWRTFPKAQIFAVDIDGQVITLAYKYFFFAA